MTDAVNETNGVRKAKLGWRDEGEERRNGAYKANGASWANVKDGEVGQMW